MTEDGRVLPIIDLHSHILPGLDDGPAQLEEAVALLKLLSADGVRTVVATPHVAPGFFWPYDPVRMADKLAELRRAAEAAGIGLQIVGGAEIYLSPDVVPLAQRGELPTLGDSRYVLVEFPREDVPFWGFEVLEKLQRAGYRPILAHPERNPAVRSDPELAQDLAREGVLLQVTAGSLAGQWGSEVAAFALHLVGHGFAQVVASDTHSLRRASGFSAAAAALTTAFGRAKTESLISRVPAAVLADGEFDVRESLETA